MLLTNDLKYDNWIKNENISSIKIFNDEFTTEFTQSPDDLLHKKKAS